MSANEKNTGMLLDKNPKPAGGRADEDRVYDRGGSAGSEQPPPAHRPEKERMKKPRRGAGGGKGVKRWQTTKSPALRWKRRAGTTM